ncbi:MAG: DUF3592 domain-containing protein [Anaerolineales bacterium]
MNEILLFIGLFAAAIIGLLFFAVVVKMRETQRAKTWQTTSGKITRSETRALKKRDIDGKESVRSAPAIAYEYTVNGKRYQGERISLAEIIPESDIEPLLARYPVGAQVTVYYDPANPRQAVLERSLPADFGKGLAGVFALLGGGALLTLLTVAKVPDLLAPHLPNPQNALFVTLSSGMGLFLLLFGFAQQRQALAMQTWRSTAGVILASELRTVRRWKDNLERTLYFPGLVYRYQVGEHEYTSDRFSLGAETEWGSPAPVQKILARFPVESPVTVYYNPQAPAESVLERRVTSGSLIWIFGFGLLVLAALSAGIL